MKRLVHKYDEAGDLTTGASSNTGKIKFDENKANSILGGITGGLDLITQGIESYKRMSELPENNGGELIRDLNSRIYNVSSFDELDNMFNTTNWAKTNYTKDDLIGMSGGEAAANIIGSGLSQGAQGAMTGLQAGGGWGALIGGVAGTVQGVVASGAGYGVRNSKAITLANTYNKEGIAANNKALNNIQQSAYNINSNMQKNALLKQAAYGGPLRHRFDKGGYTNTGYFTNGVRFIEEGQSHELNPYEGVPQGIAQDGLPNLVEEGEVIYNDYVYSRRLKVPNADKEKLGLKKNKEYSFAEAAEDIQKESEERPNDPLSKQNLREMMGRLQESQETYKAKREEAKFKRQLANMSPEEQMMLLMQMQGQGNPQEMQQQISPEEEALMQQQMNQEQGLPAYAKGGKLFHRFDKESTMTHKYKTIADWNANMPTEEGEERDQYIQEYIKFLQAQKPSFSWDDIEWSNDKLDFDPNNKENAGKYLLKRYTPTGALQYSIQTGDPTKAQGIYQDKDGWYVGEKPYDNSNSKLAQYLRAAPIFGNIIGTMSALFDKPNYSNIDRAERTMMAVPNISAGHVGQKLAYTPIDMNYIANRMNNQGIGTRRALVESGAGNPAGMQQALIANNYSNQTALGNNLIAAMQENFKNLQQVNDFNRQTDIANIGNNLSAAQANQSLAATKAQFLMETGKLRDAEKALVQGNKGTQLTSLFNEIGNYGKDMLARDMVYAGYKSGAFTNFGKNAPMYEGILGKAACGGKLRTKKGGKHA